MNTILDAWLHTFQREWSVAPLWSIATVVKQPNSQSRSRRILSLSFGRVVVRDVASNHGLLPASFDTYNVVSPGDVVLRLTDLQNDQTSLRVGRVTKHGAITSAYLTLRASEGIESRFLAYLLRSFDNQKLFYGLGSGVRQTLSFDDLRALPIPLPLLDTQRRIADMLDTETARIGALVEKKRAAVESTHARLKRLQWDLITGSSSSAARKEVALAWANTLPESWPLVSLQYLITSKYGFPFNSEGFTSDAATTPVVRIRDVLPNRVQTWTEETPVGRVWLDNGDIVIGMDGDFNHVRWAGGPAAMNQRVCSIRSSSENLTDDYLTEVLGYPLRHINETVHFTTVKHLSFADLMAEKIPVPPLAEQASIVRELSRERDATDRLASATSRSIELLRLRRQSLITAAVTGQIEV